MARKFGLISGLFARGGGYAALVERYETTAPAPGSVLRGQTVMMDNTVAYKYCVTFAASPAGLYMRPEPKGLAAHPAILIPWTEVKRVERTRLYWWPAAKLIISEPKLTELSVWMGLYDVFRPYLGGGA